jgi:polyisoprenyl-phosphate glycosyltransferase
MTATPSKVSIICPARDEILALPHLHEALFQALRALEAQHQFEILYIDDGSSDGTLGQLQTIAGLDPRVRVLSLARPFGKEAALIAGLEHATGELIVTLDADLQHPPDLLPRLLERARQGSDVVIAVDTSCPLTTWPRRLGRQLLAACCERVPPAEATDFLVLSRRAVDTLLTIPEHHRSLLGLVYWLDLPRAELPFERAPRKHGVSKSTAGRRLSRGVEHLFAYSRLPLRVSSVLGGLVLAVGLALMLWFPIQGLLRPGSVWFSWCYLIVLIHLIGGGILVSIGLVGEYLVRVLEQVKQRPLYALKHDSKATTSKVLPFAPPRDPESPLAA